MLGVHEPSTLLLLATEGHDGAHGCEHLLSNGARTRIGIQLLARHGGKQLQQENTHTHRCLHKERTRWIACSTAGSVKLVGIVKTDQIATFTIYAYQIFLSLFELPILHVFI